MNLPIVEWNIDWTGIARMTPLKYFIGFSLFSFFGVYLLFQKHLIPLPYALYVGRIWFYPTLPFTIIKFLIRRENFCDEIDDDVYLGSLPLPWMGRVEKLKKLEVKAVVNMMDEWVGPVEEYKMLGITQLYLPTIDHFEPSVEDLIRAVQFIEASLKRGHRVLIHCRAGHGRSAAVAFCWLLWKKREGAKLSQERLSQLRYVRKHLYKQSNIQTFAKQMSISMDPL